MEWELVSRSALRVVDDEYFVVDIVSVENTVGSLKNLPDEGLRNHFDRNPVVFLQSLVACGWSHLTYLDDFP